jgi:hypothetical protein
MFAIASSVPEEACWHVLLLEQEEATAITDSAAEAARIEIFSIFDDIAEIGWFMRFCSQGFYGCS